MRDYKHIYTYNYKYINLHYRFGQTLPGGPSPPLRKLTFSKKPKQRGRDQIVQDSFFHRCCLPKLSNSKTFTPPLTLPVILPVPTTSPPPHQATNTSSCIRSFSLHCFLSSLSPPPFHKRHSLLASQSLPLPFPLLLQHARAQLHTLCLQCLSAWMCVYEYIYIYLYIYVYCVYMHVCIDTYIVFLVCVCVCLCVFSDCHCACMFVCVWIYIYMYILCIHVRVCMNKYIVYACMCVYEHICICIHTYQSAFEIKTNKYNAHICVCEYTNIYMYTYIHT